MPDRIDIRPDEFNANPFRLFEKQWFLLTAGDFSAGKFNTMTVSWGYIGEMWGFPSAFSEEYRDALKLCGAKSGRELDKIAAAGLTPEASGTVSAPTFKEAELVLECRQVYQGKFVPEGFSGARIPETIYPNGDYHLVFAGEITRISGISKFISKD